MRLWVERHRSRATLGLQGLHGPEFLRRLFFHDVRHAFAARREDKLRRIVKSRAINACADGCGTDDFAALSIEHGHHLVVASGEESMMRGVERNPTWLFARRERPMRHDLMLGGIDRNDFALVFDVDVDAVGRGIDRSKFWSAAQRDSSDDI